ncbi:leucine-rich repeat domain-containing protein [endosymbiont GvMRE of Glomus versiforme]|uniref:leucine-rich repeat domain-containing protein n=1 Tax=endosymbiont GvMRE of Glomus versiforme TaxID=2039283 RepID=UPI000EE16A34|nr:leucine-rich repeat domain-containing protein [endosymbiont GvMRE of Glomus versiforme]RHZ36532.1 Serine/threonine protein kinase [endosymbiont GvMRE of Glomus versiforme]
MENNKENWKEIHKEFEYESCQKLWKEYGFDYQQTKEWKEALGWNFTVDDFAFCAWLRDEKHLTTQEVQQQNNLENLKTEYQKLWTDIHKDFSEEYYSKYRKETHQQNWEECNLTYQDAKEWIPAGFEPKDGWEVREWKDQGFTSEQVKALVEENVCDLYYVKKWKNQGFTPEQIVKYLVRIGLNLREIDFANYLKQKNIQLTADNLFQLRKEFYPGYPNAQEYLNKKYPCTCSERNHLNELIHEKNCSRNDIWEINLCNLNLEGDLDLKGFPHHSKYVIEIHHTGNPRLGEIKNKPEHVKLIYQNPQEWLKNEYSNKTQVEKIDLNLNSGRSRELIIDGYSNLKWIQGHNVSNTSKITISNCPQLYSVIVYDSNNIRDKNIRELILHNLPNLKKLDCHYNKLTTLEMNNCDNLEGINCSGNQLTEIKLPSGEKLEELNLCYNNFNQDLSFLSHLVNLKKLDLNNNPLYGSLEPLQLMNKLRWLDISNTDIDSGLEYLPNSLKEFICSTNIKKDAKVKVIEEDFEHFKDIKKLKEFNGSARKWLNENCPENGECRTDRVKPGTGGRRRRRRWYTDKEKVEGPSWHINGKKRADITELGISYEEINKNEKDENKKTKLKGGLWLKGFTDLEKLNCSDHQLTDLDLSDCPNLIELDCSNNSFKDLNFLKTLKSPEKLEKLSIQNNPQLVAKNLDSLSNFTNLKELDINDCPFGGSLKPLQNLNKLEKLNISNTNLREGLEYLPESCQILYCDSDYQYKSEKIMKELDKSKCSEGEGDKKYYIPTKWKIDKANNTTASIIPLERLFVIRGNLKQFINKWNKPHENDWYEKSKNFLQEKLLRKSTKEVSNELTKLQSSGNPDELGKDRWIIYGTQAFGRGAAIAGTVLTFQDQGTLGGGILGAYPIAELLVSKLDERLKNKEIKWNEFLNDADTFSDNFNELLGITKGIKTNELGMVNKTFKVLEKKVKDFLNDYDENKEGEEGYEEIDLEELTNKEKRKKLAQDLNDKGSKLWEIVKAIKDLEGIVTKYRQGILDEKETPEINLQLHQITNEKQSINQAKETQDKATQTENLTSESWLAKAKNLLCCRKDKNEPSLRDSLSLNNSEKELEIKESLEYLENTQEKDSYTSVKMENTDLDEHFAEKDEIEQIQVIKEGTKQEPENQEQQEANPEQKNWQNQNFTTEQTQQWIEAGLTANEANFATWLRDIKSQDLENFANPQWIKEKIATGELNLNELRQAYEQESKEVKIDMQAQVIQPPKGVNN